MKQCKHCKSINLEKLIDKEIEDPLTEDISIIPEVWKCNNCEALMFKQSDCEFTEYTYSTISSYKYNAPVTDQEILTQKANQIEEINL